MRTGGFLWWGGETTTYFLGAENEYTPLGATAFDGSLFLDPQTGDFGAVAVPDVELGAKEEEELNFAVRENGAVDLDYNLERWGYAAGTSRKRYAEMLPELRSRHFQQLLGSVAQAASATRELETDTEGYPFSLSFSAFVPGMAVVAGDAISLDVPQLAERLFALTGSARENPVGVEGEDTEKSTTFTIRFPEGYAEIEHIPASSRRGRRGGRGDRGHAPRAPRGVVSVRPCCALQGEEPHRGLAGELDDRRPPRICRSPTRSASTLIDSMRP